MSIRKRNFTEESTIDPNTGRMQNLMNNQRYVNSPCDTISTLQMGKIIVAYKSNSIK